MTIGEDADCLESRFPSVAGLPVGHSDYRRFQKAQSKVFVKEAARSRCDGRGPLIEAVQNGCSIG